MIYWPAGLKDRISWVLLLRISQSFVSKIFSGISLSVFILSHTNKFYFFQNADFSFKIVIFGGLAFLLGYVVVAVYVPSEFRETLSVNDAVLRQKNIEYLRSFRSRIDMLESMVSRISNETPPDMSDDPLIFAKLSTKMARQATDSSWKETSAALYLADLNLRQFDNFRWRMCAFSLLTVGLLSTIFSTLSGMFEIFGNWR